VRDAIRTWGLVSLLVVAAVSSVAGADRIEQFNKARRAILPLLHSKAAGDRQDGLKRLEAFPIADSVKLIQASLGDEEPEVRETAYQTLVRLASYQEVGDTLLMSARKAIGRKDGQGAAPLLAALLFSELPSVGRDTGELIDKTAATPSGLAVVVNLADELGRHGQASDVPPLVRLAHTGAFEEQIGVRRSVVQALAAIADKEAVGGLIGILDHVRGEALADAAEHLADVTGQIFGMDGGAWQRWWGEAHESFEYPRRKTPAPYRSVSLNASGEYYGLPLFAERLVFVIDTSGSMTGQRIETAKRELIRAINGLPDHAQFSVVAFNGMVSVWERQLTKATAPMKRAAIAFVNAQQPLSNTASFDALEVAMSFDTEAIYFLSDGAPHGGKIAAPDDIVAAITAMNRARRISLYTIGIGVGFEGGPLDLFLKALANQNLGLYRRIDG
jgi:hypothetical protein